MSNDQHIHIDNDEDTNDVKPNVFLRVLLVIGILIILFLIAVAIVRFVPKFISSFGQANVSLTSLFSGNSATSTPSTNGNQQNSNTNSNTGTNGGYYGNSGATTTNQNNEPTYTRPSSNTNTGTSRPTYTYPATQYQQGPADLTITLSKVGRLLPDGSFQQTSNFTAGDRVTIQFIVANAGTGRSGNWTLSGRLPTQIAREQYYTSVLEPSIPAGTSYLMTMAFDSFDPNQSSIQLTINGGDSNTSNNTLTIPVTGTQAPVPNTGNCYYSNGQYFCNINNNTNYNNNYNNNNYGCYWQNGYQVCSNSYGYNYNYATSGNCYYSNGQYYCTDTTYNNNTNNNYGCYWQNGYQVCSNTTSGYPDLSVTVISTGTVNKSTGVFTATNTITRNDRAAVRVEVRNNGSVATNQWSLTATLSGGSSNSTFSSGTQSAILPGQSQIQTVTFENPNPGFQTVSIQVMQLNSTAETNTGNNYATQSITVSN